MEQVTISQTETVVVSGLMGPKGDDGGSLSSLSAVPDVDTTNLRDGSLLVYSIANNKWQASTNLNNQIHEAGQY